MTLDKDNRNLNEGSLQGLLDQAKCQLQKGDLSACANVLETILSDEPSQRDALYLTAVVQRYGDRLDDALTTLCQLLTIHPEFDRGYQERGHNYRLLNLPLEAIAAYEAAININPLLVACRKNLIGLYESIGETQRSVYARREVARLEGMPKPLLKVASLLHQGHLFAAEQKCRAFLKKYRHHPEAMRLLAAIGIKLNILDDAEVLLENCIRLAPDFHLAHFDYVAVLHKRQRFLQAYEQAKKLVALDSDNSSFQMALANACIGIRDFDAGLSIYRQLSQQNSNNHLVHMSYGHALKAVGQQENAISAYRRAFSIKADHGDAFWSMANLKTYRFSDEEIAVMVSKESAEDIGLVDRYHMCFALGKAFEDRQDFERSFNYYQQGNALKRDELGYDPERINAELERQKTFFDGAFFSATDFRGCLEPDPIFVVGLPRAGSTLLEQILASHSQVDGTLELPNILALVHRLNGRQLASSTPKYPGVISDLTEEDFKRYGQEYLDSTRVYRQGAPFFTDKMPNNFRHIGLIHLLLPNAKIIDARRHPMACCFSGFKQIFAEGQEFTYGLSDIGAYYRGYIELIDHWQSILPDKILTVQYEDVVSDIETQVARILDFCKLPFERECIDFHKTERAVQTASSEQVRQPLYRSGLEQWQHFHQYLQPLEDALGEEVMCRYPIDGAR